MIDKERLAALAKEQGIELTERMLDQFSTYAVTLQEWNQVMNLTAIVDDEGITVKHFLDSLLLIDTLNSLQMDTSAMKMIDVGTGAGFPGMPLAIACPQLSVTLVDAQQKRLTFLQAVIDALGLTNVRLFHARAEDSGRSPELREQFDLAVARAVAPTPVLAEYLLPFVRIGGKAVCWKGPALAEELEQGRRAAFLVGGKLGEPIPMTIPGRDWQHQLLPMAKVAKTARLYPRKSGTPTKKPLG